MSTWHSWDACYHTLIFAPFNSRCLCSTATLANVLELRGSQCQLFVTIAATHPLIAYLSSGLLLKACYRSLLLKLLALLLIVQFHLTISIANVSHLDLFVAAAHTYFPSMVDIFVALQEPCFKFEVVTAVAPQGRLHLLVILTTSPKLGFRPVGFLSQLMRNMSQRPEK